MRVDYEWPEGAVVSPECKDLISRMLVLNPAERLTSSEIQQHPFFLKDLPQEWYERQIALCERLPDLPGSALPTPTAGTSPPVGVGTPGALETGGPPPATVGLRPAPPPHPKPVGTVPGAGMVLEGTRSAPAASMFPYDTGSTTEEQLEVLERDFSALAS